MAYENFDEKHFDKLNEIFKIPKKKYIFQLSKGMKMRLSIMLAFSIKAKYLVLDEPTSGLDAILKKKLLQIFSDEVYENNQELLINRVREIYNFITSVPENEFLILCLKESDIILEFRKRMKERILWIALQKVLKEQLFDVKYTMINLINSSIINQSILNAELIYVFESAIKKSYPFDDLLYSNIKKKLETRFLQ